VVLSEDVRYAAKMKDRGRVAGEFFQGGWRGQQTKTARLIAGGTTVPRWATGRVRRRKAVGAHGNQLCLGGKINEGEKDERVSSGAKFKWEGQAWGEEFTATTKTNRPGVLYLRNQPPTEFVANS